MVGFEGADAGGDQHGAREMRAGDGTDAPDLFAVDRLAGQGLDALAVDNRGSEEVSLLDEHSDEVLASTLGWPGTS